jgi:hypothetical protein
MNRLVDPSRHLGDVVKRAMLQPMVNPVLAGILFGPVPGLLVGLLGISLNALSPWKVLLREACVELARVYGEAG